MCGTGTIEDVCIQREVETHYFGEEKLKMEFVHIELKRDTWSKPVKHVKNPEEAVDVIKKMIENFDREMLLSIQLARSGEVINASICSVGSVDCAYVFAGGIVRTAVMSGASTVILIHNHPSGNPRASKADWDVTKRLAIACKIFNLELLDHIIIGANNQKISLKEDYKELFDVSLTELKELMTE